MAVSVFGPAIPVFIGGVAPGQSSTGCAPQVKMFDVFYISSQTVGFLPSEMYNNPSIAGFDCREEGSAFLYFGGYDNSDSVCSPNNEGMVFLFVENEV